ncbi:Putative alkyl/aryl-sulfatase YjcS [Sinobacterium norvegicum]|uniref:Alkyl/aryl-sulfatase YjcS n=1 Tax=Sinobacterium norvegicum TaxID=1641715 RepID=A0ABN8EFS5_9GAMM|nr:alkyl sulfatase dimerization domain-containing protein [Sinobacterium norvegicum]CAH0991202.1 Putative alkyl/aryl-sulfatase YjcS [Sinobacterium norvegicum]
MKLTYIMTYLALALAATAFADEAVVLDYQGKPATAATIAQNKAFAVDLNWQDVTAFENAKKGLIAPFDQNTADLMRNDYLFINQTMPDSINPSLYRQATLNMAAEGLYQVREGVYQVRGADLSNMTLIRSDNGWIVLDVLLTREAAKASLEFALANMPEGGEAPVVAMIYSHSHGDHFGGSRGVTDLFPDIDIYAPVGMTEEVISENLLAGNAMSRRTVYQYGSGLQAHPHGIVDAALGKALSEGSIDYALPTQLFNQQQRQESHTIDGVELIALDVPGAEAPAETVLYFPAMKMLWTAELTFHGMHNIYTLRGAKVRDALAWSKYINEMLVFWGDEAETLIASHSSPIWGGQNIRDFLTLQRDNYGFVHNQAMRLANNGVVIQDIGEALEALVPATIKQSWATNGYHGSYSHNAKAVYNRYLGYFDMNPANLNPLPTLPEALKYVEYMGGSHHILKRAQQDYTAGEYRFVSTVLNHLVTAEPGNIAARELLADSYEQLGYQAETAGWRNIYLTGALELREGIQHTALKPPSKDVMAELTFAELFDLLAVRVDSNEAEEIGFVNFNVIDPSNGVITYVELSNANLNNIVVAEARPAQATLTISSKNFVDFMIGERGITGLIFSGDASVDGNPLAILKVLSTLVEPDPYFAIVPSQ